MTKKCVKKVHTREADKTVKKWQRGTVTKLLLSSLVDLLVHPLQAILLTAKEKN